MASRSFDRHVTIVMYLGCHLDARAGSALVKLFHRGQLVKTR
jgi:hypothetical protein